MEERIYQGCGNKIFDANAIDNIIRDPRQYVIEASFILCDNRWSYFFTQWVEDKIIDAYRGVSAEKELVDGVIQFLHCNNGDLRVGAAELLGIITPTELEGVVIPELEKHLSDDSMRSCMWCGALGDEEDVRTVSGCATKSIEALKSRAPVLSRP